MQDALIPYTTRTDTYNYYETRNYVNDVNQEHTQVLQTYDDQLQKRETYTYGNGRASYTDEVKGASYNYLTNVSGSTVGQTQGGQAVASSSYELYGSFKSTTDRTGNSFHYNGEARDVTGFDYLRARYYDSQAGTFLTEDSYPGQQTDPLSQNGYSYVENNPVNYTDPSGHSIVPMMDGGGGSRKYSSPKPRMNYADGTLYAPNTPQHRAHQVRQQQTGVNTYIYIPLATSRQFATAQQAHAYAQAMAYQQRQQQVNRDYQRATGNKGKPKSKEAQNLLKNWTKAFEETIKHFCDPKTHKAKDNGKDASWKSVGASRVTDEIIDKYSKQYGLDPDYMRSHRHLFVHFADLEDAAIARAKKDPKLTSTDITILSGISGLLAGAFGGPVAGFAAYGGVNAGLTSISKGSPPHIVAGQTLGGAALGGLAGAGVGGISKLTPIAKFVLGTLIDTGLDVGISAINGDKPTLQSLGISLGINALFNGVGAVFAKPKTEPVVGGASDLEIANNFVNGLEDITKHANWGTKQYLATGGYDGAVEKFNSLGLTDVKPFIDSYGGQAYLGNLPGGTTVVVRSSSSYGTPTIEFQLPDRKYEIRFGE